MRKIIAGSLNIDASDDWMKFMPNCFKCLRASGDDLSVVEVIKLQERVDMRNYQNTNLASKVEVLGCMDHTMDNTFESANRVYDVNGVAPTINTCGGGGLQPKILEVTKLDTNKLGFIEHGTGKHQSNTVFGTDSVSPAITTIEGGGTQQIKICDVKQLGHLEKGTGAHQSNIVYDENGLSPCICAGMGVKQQPTMILEQRIVAMRGRNPDDPSDRTPGAPTEQRLEPNEQGICNALTSVQKDNLVLEIKQGINPKYHDFIYEIDGEFYLIRIRKLMPIECWRLMNFTDHDFNKAQEVVSNSQLYKSAGNSIVVSVLMAIFSQLNISGVKPWNEMTDDERYNLIYKE